MRKASSALAICDIPHDSDFKNSKLLEDRSVYKVSLCNGKVDQQIELVFVFFKSDTRNIINHLEIESPFKINKPNLPVKEN